MPVGFSGCEITLKGRWLFQMDKSSSLPAKKYYSSAAIPCFTRDEGGRFGLRE